MKHAPPGLEARIEKFIYSCRFMTFLAIGGSLLGSVPCFLKVCPVLASFIHSPIRFAIVSPLLPLPDCELHPGILQGCVYVMDAFLEYYLHGGAKVTVVLVQAIGK
jgi:hypothetical protein